MFARNLSFLMRPLAIPPVVEYPSLCFEIGSDASGATPFSSISGFDANDFVVKVNGQDTSMSIESISALAGDVIEIERRRNGSLFPRLAFTDTMNMVSKILKPFPELDAGNLIDLFYNCSELTSVCEDLMINNPQITAVDYMFQNTGITTLPASTFRGCVNIVDMIKVFSGSGLKSLPAGIFDDLVSAETFEDCFYGCENLESLPDGLFSKCSAVKNLKWTFQNCSSLTTVPRNIFVGCDAIEDVFRCFMGCESLTVGVEFTARNIGSADDFAWNTAEVGTVYVPAGSKTANTFSGAVDPYVNVVEI